MSDLRTPIAKDRDAFLDSEDGQRIIRLSGGDQYARNRIESAWIAGWNSNPAQAEVERLTARFTCARCKKLRDNHYDNGFCYQGRADKFSIIDDGPKLTTPTPRGDAE